MAGPFGTAGIITIASFISPDRLDRDVVRAGMAPGDAVEVYVKVSLATAEHRDAKGLHQKGRAGQIAGFTGIDGPCEQPLTRVWR